MYEKKGKKWRFASSAEASPYLCIPQEITIHQITASCSDRTPSAVRSVSVRRPFGFRPRSVRVSSAVHHRVLKNHIIEAAQQRGHLTPDEEAEKVARL